MVDKDLTVDKTLAAKVVFDEQTLHWPHKEVGSSVVDNYV